MTISLAVLRICHRHIITVVWKTVAQLVAAARLLQMLCPAAAVRLNAVPEA